jgi:DNA (cytosine-5)-methyltransferase 1
MVTIPVIDMFAGPGGLGEGFASYRDENSSFSISLSVEKDEAAQRTLLLRKFFREFPHGEAPDAYYEYVRSGSPTDKELFDLFPAEYQAAENAMVRETLGRPGFDYATFFNRITKAISGQESWALIGGPPCQAYSVIGRSRMRGADPKAFSMDSRHTLYQEYLRILAEFRPPVFVMENVKGLLSSKLGNQTAAEKILADLSEPAVFDGEHGGTRYHIYSLVPGKTDGGHFDNLLLKPSDYVIKSELHGVPQSRHRVILLGIRSDIASIAIPESLKEVGNKISVSDVISDLPPLRSRLSREQDTFHEWNLAVREAAIYTEGDYVNEAVAECLVEMAEAKRPDLISGGRFVRNRRKPRVLRNWYYDPRLKGALNHEARQHIRGDIHRYLFASCFAAVTGFSPKLSEFPKELLPDHKNVRNLSDTDRFSFQDRFRVQCSDRPSTTVTSHISKDGHYFIHPDPIQCRSLTVREAARLQTFPDNYFFEGNRTQQYSQVGNAVPPLLAYQIAKIVHGVLSVWSGQRAAA